MRRMLAEKDAERANLFKMGMGTDKLHESATSELIHTIASSRKLRQPSTFMPTSGHICMPVTERDDK